MGCVRLRWSVMDMSQSAAGDGVLLSVGDAAVAGAGAFAARGCDMI